jgi:cytochrome c oxidase subunit 4
MSEHIVPRKVYFLVAAALMVGLVLTYLVALRDLGPFNVVVALTIASIKALLVVLYFMEVRYESRLTWIVAGAGFFWLVILIGITLSDYVHRVPIRVP